MLKKQKNKKYIIGLDVDSSKIGVSIIDFDGICKYSVKITSNFQKYYDRTINLYHQLLIILNQYNIVFAVIEDYGYSPIQRNAVTKAELISLIKHLLMQNSIPYLKWLSIVKKKNRTYTTECMVSPSQLTKWIFGKGRMPSSGKSSKLMLIAFKEFNKEFVNDDECDAYYLAQIGRTFIKCYKSKNNINSLKQSRKELINIWLKNYNGKEF